MLGEEGYSGEDSPSPFADKVARQRIRHSSLMRLLACSLLVVSALSFLRFLRCI